VFLFSEMTMLLIIGIDPPSRLARLWVQKNQSLIQSTDQWERRRARDGGRHRADRAGLSGRDGIFVFDLSCVLSAGHVERGWVLFRILSRPRWGNEERAR
jgi:hypothetical protein